jgi:hypothetical protein
MTAPFPVSYLDWEVVLTRRYLAIGNGDASDIRSFEVTARTLAEAIGLDPELGKARSLEAFRSLFVSQERSLVEALRHGNYREYSDAGVPGCFAYLALTMLVEGQSDPEANGHEFRPKLETFLGIDRNFAHLSGINSMWIDLRDWLQSQSERGLPFRLLHLPEQDSRVQIGYSVRLSFPSRRDKTVVEKFLDDHNGILNNPLEFLNQFRRFAEGPRPSEDLKSAFKNFRDSYLRGYRALSDHRFWSLVQAINLGRKTSTAFELIVEMARDEDGLWWFAVSDASSGSAIGVYGTLDEAVAVCQSQGIHGLTKAIDIGLIFFRQTGHARWEAMPSLADGVTKVAIGLSPQLAGEVGVKLGPLERSGQWFLTGTAVPAGKAQDCLRMFVKLPDPQQQILNVRVFGGVRTAGLWLGRPRFLPKVSADAAGVSISPRLGKAGGPRISCVEVDAGTYAIESDIPLDGSYIVQPLATSAEATPSWSRNITFMSDAHVHHSIPEAKAIPIPEWKDVVVARERIAVPVLTWAEVDPALDDLIEAVYAGGRGGWNENELVPIISDVLRGNASPWDFLRSLQEASMLLPYLKTGWKGRTWALTPPSVVPLNGSLAGLVVVDGCVGKRLVDDFRDATSAMGGRPFRAAGAAKWSPPLIGATGVDPRELAVRLGWKLGTCLVAGDTPASFVQTGMRHDFYAVASQWSWERRHFVTGRGEENAPVRIVRWINRGARDHDVYVVSDRGRETRYASRSAAIAFAHIANRVAMYSAETGKLIRTAAEGALPGPVAAWLRYGNLRNPGASGMRRYAYPAQAGDLAKLSRILPGLVDCIPSPTPIEAANASRRSGGSTRLLWMDEGIRATRVSSPHE